MSRQRHDHLGKGLFTEWLSPLGRTQTSRPLIAEERAIDVVANAVRSEPRWRRALGLIGQMARGQVSFEVFRNPVGVAQVRACSGKQLDLERERRGRRRAKKPVRMWVVTPTLSDSVRSSLRLSPAADWPEGFLDAGAWGVRLVVVHDLEATPATLFLRLLGRDAVQEQAFRELFALPQQHPLRSRTLLRVLRFRREAEQATRPTQEQKEFVMKNRDVYDEFEREILSRGEAKGRAEGKAEGVLTVLKARGVKVPPRIQSRVRTCTSSAQLDRLLRRAGVVGSAAELFA